MDSLPAQDHDEINALLKAAYDARQHGESAPLEPLHVLSVEERTRFQRKVANR